MGGTENCCESWFIDHEASISFVQNASVVAGAKLGAASVGPRFKSWRAHQLFFKSCQHSQLTCPFFALFSNLRTSENKTPATRSTARRCESGITCA